MADRSPLDREIADRLAGLERGGGNDRADVLARLVGATGRGRRARVRRRRTVTGVATLAIMAVALVSAVTFGHLRNPTQAQPARNQDPILGTYSADVGGTPAGLSRLSGHWRLELRSDGTLGVVAPKGFRGIATGFHFSTEGDDIRVDLFIQDLCAGLPAGTYTWARDITGLRLRVVDDQCVARSALLTGRTWNPGP